jgi:DNA (cytosine-5)-methyltransferase 1
MDNPVLGGLDNHVDITRASGVVTRTVTWRGVKYQEAVSSHRDDLSAVADFYVSYLSEESPRPLYAPRGRLRYIDLFSGGGGLSLGVHNAARLFGYKPTLVAAADSDQFALDLVARHFNPVVRRQKDIRELLGYRVDLSDRATGFIEGPIIKDNQLAQLVGKVELLVGGPPCQGHSSLNNRTRGDDPRNLLYFAMPAMALALRIPKLIIENVPSIRFASEDVVGITTKILQGAGYHVQEAVLNAAEFGVAQHRKRHFLVASATGDVDLSGALAAFKAAPISFDDACGKLGPLPFEGDIVENAGALSEENLRRIKYLFLNQLYDLPNPQRPDCHKDHHTYTSVYGRIRPNEPMGTVTTGFGSPGRGRYVHPTEQRVLNIREAGRIQGFPDFYWRPAVEAGLKRNSYQKIIGDAVPSLLVYPLIGAAFSDAGRD